jgi:hypothetical protein
MDRFWNRSWFQYLLYWQYLKRYLHNEDNWNCEIRRSSSWHIVKYLDDHFKWWVSIYNLCFWHTNRLGLPVLLLLRRNGQDSDLTFYWRYYKWKFWHKFNVINLWCYISQCLLHVVVSLGWLAVSFDFDCNSFNKYWCSCCNIFFNRCSLNWNAYCHYQVLAFFVYVN